MTKRMKRVVLVDDEREVVESISKIVDWEAFGFQLTSTCLNAFQALGAIQKDSPDIVITDIKMPVMDGIELIRKTREFNTQVKFIILSGYGEFPLAQKAMKEGVREFLLKPCSENEIIEALLNVCEGHEVPRENIVPGTAGISRDVVDMITKYVDKNYYAEDLNLKWVANNLVFLNEDYLGKLFLQRTGCRFTVYLNEVRIKRAKEYMENYPDMSNERIAAEVGFGNNPKYFGKVFTKYAGYTIKEYKKQIK